MAAPEYIIKLSKGEFNSGGRAACEIDTMHSSLMKRNSFANLIKFIPYNFLITRTIQLTLNNQTEIRVSVQCNICRPNAYFSNRNTD
jgi:hypothetical protein